MSSAPRPQSQAKRSTIPSARSAKLLPTAALVASAKSGHSSTSPVIKALGDSLSCTCGQQFTNAGKFLNHSRLCGGVAIQRSPVQPHLLSGSAGSPLGLPHGNAASYWREEQRKVLMPKVAMRLPPQSPTAKSMLYCSAKAVALAGTDGITTSSHPSVSGASVQMSEDDQISLSGFELQDDNNNNAFMASSCFEPCPSEDFGTCPPSSGSSSSCGSD